MHPDSIVSYMSKKAEMTKSLIDVDLVVKVAWGLTAFAAVGVIPYFIWKDLQKKRRAVRGRRNKNDRCKMAEPFLTLPS